MAVANKAERMQDHDTRNETPTPKSKLFGGIVIAALVIAIILLATGAVKFGPF